MPLAAGQRLRNIRVEQLLGSGGMSEVWRGFDERLRRPVALKVVHSKRHLDPLARARVLREAQILSSLEHPGICRVFDLIEEDDEEVLVLELVEGACLREAMDSGLSDERKLAIAEGIADVLAAAHRLGIVHRDLKPQNVICTPSGGVKVLDFDLARRVGEETVAVAREGLGEHEPPPPSDRSHVTLVGSVVGTVGYMSPEQARGEQLTVASDLYSLGVLLHELLAGRPAYPEALSFEARLLRVGQAQTLPVEGVEPELAELIEALEDLDPDRRPTAEEVVRRLRALRRRSLTWSRRRLLVVAAAMLALAASAWLSLELVPELTRGSLKGVKRVVLLRVFNATGETAHDWVGAGLTPMLAVALEAGSGLEVVIQASGEAAGPVAAADVVVRTRLERRHRDLRLRAALRTASGEVGGCEAVGPSPLDAAEGLVAALCDRLRPGAAPPHLGTAFSRDLNADLLYGLGLDARRNGRLEEARRSFELCLDRDPGFLWARVELVRCALEAGRVEEAKAAAGEVAAEARRRGRADVAAAAAELLASLPR